MIRKRGLLASLLRVRPKTYKGGRVLDDLNAVTKGASGISKRLVRKSAWKTFAKALRKLGL